MSKRLFLFTAVYPYCIYGDNFIEREMDYLLNEFEEIVIIPYCKEVEERKELSSKCRVLPPVLDSKSKFIWKGLYSYEGMRLLFPELLRHKTFANHKKFLVWVKAYSFLNNLCNRKDIREIGDNLNPNDVCYFYWGKWGNMLSVVWQGKAHFVSRFHGEWDLWEESSGNYTPLREKVASCLDFAAFISKKGERYFLNRYNIKRTLFAPLGSVDFGVSRKSTDGIVRIFTCSNVIPLKRVDLIFDCINKYSENHSVEWTHIGGGDDLQGLVDYVSSKCHKNLNAKLLGIQDHSVVVQYYQNNPIDLFINLSTIEGVPVSIMEALSCNVPVVATDVGGVCEIVTEETGVLVDANPSVNDVVAAIEKALTNNFTPREFWDAHYNADRNYSSFAQELSNL